MKKIIILSSILFIVILAIMLVSFNRIKLGNDYELIEFDKLIVDIVDGKATKNIETKNIKIKNIEIEDKVLKFDLIGNKDEISSRRLEVSLLNDFAMEPGNVFAIDLYNFEEKKEIDNGYHIELDITEPYNNPYRVKLELR